VCDTLVEVHLDVQAADALVMLDELRRPSLEHLVTVSGAPGSGRLRQPGHLAPPPAPRLDRIKGKSLQALIAVLPGGLFRSQKLIFWLLA